MIAHKFKQSINSNWWVTISKLFCQYQLIIYKYMSTLAAARADNYYYSKNYDHTKVPEKKQADQPFKVVEGQRVGGSKVRY